MNNIENLTLMLKNKYGAEPMPAEDAVNWTEEDETLVIGYRFPDKEKSRALITEKEAEMLTDEQKHIYETEKKDPFKDVMAIVYRDKEDNINLRVTNGFAGNVYLSFSMWKNEIDPAKDAE